MFILDCVRCYCEYTIVKGQVLLNFPFPASCLWGADETLCGAVIVYQFFRFLLYFFSHVQGYLSSSSPVTAFLLQTSEEVNEAKGQRCPQVISLQSTSRPGCIIELDSLNDAKHVSIGFSE